MIQELPYQFDLKRLREYFISIKDLGIKPQVSLTHRPHQPEYVDGCGSAYLNQNVSQQLFKESDFSCLIGGENNPIFDIVSEVKAVAKQKYELSIGRIRFLTQNPKTCLSYHRDLEAYRFHIPIITNKKCFFVVNDRVFRMPNEGQLYTLKTDQIHTPVNANLDLERTHLVFTTFR